MIGIVDYGLGNVRAFENIYRRLNIAVKPVHTADELMKAERLILPGVGAFDWAMSCLSQSGMIEVLNQRVLKDKIPVLGVCVGMQMMGNRSEEGVAEGLGWIDGHVERFSDNSSRPQMHLPHMGWNSVEVGGESLLFDGLAAPSFYFLHSYFFKPADDRDVLGYTHYGVDFACAINRENIWATQFHPEKSHNWGIRLLRNFSQV